MANPEVKSQSSPALNNELESTFQELQVNTITMAILGVFIAGVFMLGTIAFLDDFLWAFATGSALLLLTLVLILIREKSLFWSACLLVAGSLGAVASTIWWGSITEASCLLILPVGLATMLFGTRTGIAMAICCSLMLFKIDSGNSPDRIVSLIVIWSTVGMIWLTLRPLLTAVEGAWLHYEESREFLNQAQDYQMQLKQTLDDFKDTNVQLTRLNLLANNLRQIAENERHAKEQFVANVSHELRTPLNMIIGFCEVILNSRRSYGRSIPSKLLADLEVVQRNSQHLSSLIDDVLDLSQIEAGQMALSKEPSALSEIIEAATIAVRPLYESKNLYLNIEIEPDLPILFCDRTRIREVLLNLLSNAGRFTEKGGVTLRAWQADGYIRVSVADTGKGISEEDKGKLFQPFQQLDGSIRRKYGGTGLGLNISKSFVELHDGKMWVESEEGQGTTLFFRLPLEIEGPLHSSYTRWFNPHLVRWERDHLPNLPPVDVRPRLVVVDPHSELGRILSRHMENYEIRQAETIDVGFQLLSETPTRALIINALQPEETISRLQGMGPLPYNTPAIIYSIPTSPVENESLGIANYLVKPVSQVQLLKALNDLAGELTTILIVDNDPDAQLLFWRMLISAEHGYHILRANNGLEALEILKQQEVDLILLDWAMPEMNGIQFLADKALNPGWSQIPVIVVSERDPLSEQISSNTLTVMRKGGLSVQQLLACFDALSLILSPAGQETGLEPGGAYPG
jgi:signal transduction histidine kinase/CheY-like chemotaxis protein